MILSFLGLILPLNSTIAAERMDEWMNEWMDDKWSRNNYLLSSNS
jgi:hypothetical protein